MEDQEQLCSSFNSRRVTRTHARALAKELGLPTTASREDTIQMISGKLEGKSYGKQPSNVQIVIVGDKVQLMDNDSIFLEATLEEEDAEEDAEDELPEGSEAASLHESQPPSSVEVIKRFKRDMAALKLEVQHQTDRIKELWLKNCNLLGEIEKRDDKIIDLEGKLRLCKHPQPSPPPPSSSSGSNVSKSGNMHNGPLGQRRGRAPPVDPFWGDKEDLTFEDWLPTLERAAQWYGWTRPETLLQLVGYLRGRAWKEWNILSEQEKNDYEKVVGALQSRLDPGNRTLADQEFRHLHQKDGETVSDFMRQLEKTFRIAYGKDPMTADTRQLLYGQLREGRQEDLIKNPAVAGAKDYLQLCMAAKGEEKHVMYTSTSSRLVVYDRIDSKSRINSNRLMIDIFF